MCGIAGIIHLDGKSIDFEILEKMTTSVSHRGPDGYGFTAISSQSGAFRTFHNQPIKDRIGSQDSQAFNIGLGHRRLAIIDLSHSADQPMQNVRGDICITYNGEVYNYIELMQDLKSRGHKFFSHSDTEVILHAYEEWGIDCLEKLEGMFAFGIWDQKKRRLFCARDRFGMKPFYFYHDGKSFLFGSEIKQFFFFPFITKEANDLPVYDYLMHGFLDHSNQTLYRNIYQLEPGHFLTLDLDASRKEPDVASYWQLKDGLNGNRSGTDDDYSNQFYEIFARSVSKHLRSDVQVGSCLSGGLDSSSVVGMIHHLRTQGSFSDTRQLTFTSCFDEKSADERPFSDAVVDMTKAVNHQLFPNMNQTLDTVSNMLSYHDEPFGSTSQYAQWCLFREIQKSGTKVVLDGQGADEVLAGYHSVYGAYFLELFKQLRWLKLLTEINSCRDLHHYKNKDLLKFVLSSLAIHTLGMRLGFLRSPPPWMGTDFFNKAKKELNAKHRRFSAKPLHNFLALLIQFNLNGLLRYEDRSSMAHSVEARLPFLDHHLVEFLFNIPSGEKIKNGWTKSILRESMKNRIPEMVRLRKDKMGFVTPEHQWMRTLSNTVASDLLHSSAVRDSGYFKVDKALEEFRFIARGEKPFNFRAWRILNLSLWLIDLKK